MKNKIQRYILVTILCLILPYVLSAQVLNIKGSSNFFLNTGSTVQVNGGLKIESGASVTHKTGGESNLYMSGKFTLLGTYSQNSNGKITFNKSGIDTIAGSSSITIARLFTNKTDNNRVVLDPAVTLTISDYLMLLYGSIELVNSDLIILPLANIYSSLANDVDLLSFTKYKSIINSGSATDPLLGGHLIRMMGSSLATQVDVLFPVGTPSYYSPAKIQMLPNGATLGSNPEISIKPVDKEHPMVEVNDASLIKYWVCNSNDITMNPSGATTVFYYNAGEVKGVEGSYVILYYSPSYNSPSGYWRIDPGNDNDVVDFNQKFFYSIKVDSIKGDWTAGLRDVSSATYYSRQSGPWNDKNTWSKTGFGGVASNTIPNKQSDRVRIQKDTVTITTAPAPARIISLEDGTEGRGPGTLIINDNYYLTGDSAIIAANTTLGFGNQNGISTYPTNTGAVRTAIRFFSGDATYEFVGSNNQLSGNGITNLTKGIIINKDNLVNTVTMEKNISINSFFKIINGTFDLSSYTLNGSSAGRTFQMDGGEFITRSDFPVNYTPPTFAAGKITFDGTGNATIPSSTYSTAILQYNDLKISGTARAGKITFPNSGEIKIKNSLDISSLNFVNNTYGFLTDGSTVRFNKNGGTQLIPLKPASPSTPADTIVYLSYYNLILDSNGTKQLSASGTPTFKVLKDITLDNNVDFDANNIDLDLSGNWTNLRSSNFIPGTGTVIMRSPVSLNTTNITSRDTVDNVFNNLIITGAGIVQYMDNIKVLGNFTIASGANIKNNNNILALYGNWTNLGGTHQYGTSTIRFSKNTSQQTITSNAIDVNFYNIIVDNPYGVDASAVGGTTNGVIINNDLTLKNGNLKSHTGSNYRYVKVIGNLTRPGNGFVDGQLCKNIPGGALSISYEVGYNKSYTPVTLDFVGTGGNPGFLGVISDTLGVAALPSSPLVWNDATPTDITPGGTTLNMAKHIARQYSVSAPSWSTFSLGTLRTYNSTLNFIPGASPNGDIRNSSDYNIFTFRLRSGSNWITPLYYGTKPVVTTRTSSSIQLSQLNDFGTFLIGEPGMIIYYSIASGNWDVPSNWSTQGYTGTPSSTYPGQLVNYKVLIGNSQTITMTAPRTITNITGDSAFVQIDSSGRLNMENYVLDGNGAFRLMKNSTIGIGSSAGINTVPTNTGNIQTGTRNYNYGSHNLGHFIYNGTGAQNTGNGLPSGTDSVNKLFIDKPSGTLTVNSTSNIHIKDSLYLKSGTFDVSTFDLYLYKNYRKASGATFIPNTRTVYIRGINAVYLSSENYNEPLTFYKLSILKGLNTGDVFLGPLTTLLINNNLTFETGNKSKIDATANSSEIKPLYVQFGSSATVTGAGHINLTLSGGWVYGEVRKNIITGDAPAISFETGTSMYYTPYTVDFAAGTGTGGYLSAKAIAGNHPKLYSTPSTLYPINPNRNITVYWKLKKPVGSTFDRGNRSANFRIDFVNPDLQTNTDCFGCADMAFYRGGDSLQWWQTMALNGTGENNSNGSGLCSDTRLTPHPTPNFGYSGDPCSSSNTLVYIQVNGVTSASAFGTKEIYANLDTLLGDFVAGNRNSLKYYNFYSIKDGGNWSDPLTWSTVSYNSTVNAAALDPDPMIRPVPVRQYDNVYIGNGKKVKLDMFIGTNDINSPANNWTYAGPSTFIENTGTLDFGTTVYRGNQFNALKGSTLILGSNEGIVNNTSSNIGNVQICSAGAGVVFKDSINVIYSPNGRTLNGQKISLVDRNSTTHYIESVTIRKVSDNSIVMQYSSGNKYLLATQGHLRAPASCTLNVGESYYIQINPSNTAGTRRFKGWLDYSYNYVFTDTNEPLFNTTSSDTALVQSANFMVPAATDQGTTLLRIGIGSPSGTDFAPTDAGTGEFEDYTIYIKNPAYIANQVTGVGLPTLLKSISVQSPNPAITLPNVTLGKAIIVLDSVKFISGQFKQSTFNIDLYGDFVHDSTTSYIAGTGIINLLGSNNQYFRGNASATLNNLNVNKTGTSKVYLNNNLTINNTLSISSDNNLVLNTNNTLTFGTAGLITPGAGAFSSTRMIETSGLLASGLVTKNYTTSAGGPKIFTFPLGNAGLYNGVYLSLTTTALSGTPSVTLQAIDDKQPDRLTDSTIKQYWKISQTNLDSTKITTDSLSFYYNQSEVSGRENYYIPGRRRNAPLPLPRGWEIDLGTNPKTDTLNNKINIKDEKIIDGDWTTGEPLIYFPGRIFFSKKTGVWNDRTCWSTEPVLKHAGPSAAYFPGQLYKTDTVNIDGHTITFQDSTHISIDSLRIGGTNAVAGQGILFFGSTPAVKTLELRQLYTDGTDNGLISGSTLSRQDTIKLTRDFYNNSPSKQLLRNSSSSSTHLVFAGSGNSRIYGTGGWGALGNVFLNKSNGLSDTLRIDSPNFALASDTTANYTFYFRSGMLYHSISSNLYLSSGQTPTDMLSNSGIIIKGGSVRSKSTITTNSNNYFLIDGGDFYVGDNNHPDEHFLYNTGTDININNGNMIVAGAFAKAFPSSLINFLMNGNNYVKVNSATGTYTDATKTGFDISNSASSFSMNSGRIIIANAGGTTPGSADYRVSSQFGTGMAAGYLQSGDSLLTPATTTIKIAGNTPVYNLHFANASGRAVTSRIDEGIFTIKNNWTVDANHSFNLNGNTVNLAGHLTNYGTFTGVPVGTTANPWLIVLNGSLNQVLFSNTSNIELYNLRVSKSSGNVMLSASGSSNLVVRNTLEFASGNQSYINADSTGRYVELSPTATSNPSIFRIGLGHVFGRLYRYIPVDVAVLNYPVGADTITSYRPVTIETAGTGGTAGLVGVRAYSSQHPNVATSPFRLDNNIKKYWNLDIKSGGTFSLGTRTFATTLQFIKPQDMNGSNYLFNEEYLFSPAAPAAGTWFDLFSPNKTDTTIKSINNTTFGDFVIGEPSGLTYYSYNSGSWNDISTWSTSGYTTMTAPTRPPNAYTDIVRIGNNKVVTLPDNFNDTVRSVFVERYNNKPGSLYIVGSLNFIRGTSFVLEDSCTLGLMHLNGITPASQGNSGAIQTTLRSYGVSRYIYFSNLGSQNAGVGLPDSVKCLIIDNPSSPTRSVFINSSAGLIKVADTLLIHQGELSAGSKDLNIYRVLELDSVQNNGRFISTTSKITFGGLNDKNLIINNRNGIDIYNQDIIGGTVKVTRPFTARPDSAHLYIGNVLNFINPNSYLELNDYVNLVMNNSATTAIQNYGSNKFIKTSLTSGYLIRKVDPSVSDYVYPIGTGADYNPVSFNGSTGTSGYLGIRVSPGSQSNSAHLGSSGIASNSFLKKYWTIDSVTAQINGKFRFNYIDSDISGVETNFTKIGRWRPVKEQIPGAWLFPFNPPTINTASNYFETNANYAFSEFQGDWTLGSDNYFRRLFFSRASGNWNDVNTWTFNPNHNDVSAGFYPNLGADSVTIGGGNNGVNNHVVNLNVTNPFASPYNVGVTVGTTSSNTGSLNLNNNVLNGNNFYLKTLSTIYVGSPDGISTTGSNTGNIQTTDSRSYSTTANYVYNGNVNQITGTGLPSNVKKLTIDNQGVAGSNFVTLTNNVDVSDSLTVRTGKFDVGTLNVSPSNGTAFFRLYDNAIFALGGANNMSVSANNFSSYNISTLSWIEFYGNNQVISNLPVTLTQDFNLNTGGFGSVRISNAGIKNVNAALLLRGNLDVNIGSSLIIATGVNSLSVRGSVINQANINNQGILEIGN